MWPPNGSSGVPWLTLYVLTVSFIIGMWLWKVGG